MKIHAGQVEVAVAKLLNYRVYTIVPNVFWGLDLWHECDMLALDKQGRFTEIEIKVSASDLKADFKKSHGHKSKFISRLFYAMPIDLCEKYADLIPNHCGIISVKPQTFWRFKKESSSFEKRHGIALKESFEGYKAEFYRQAKHDKTKDKPDEKTIIKFMQLGCMRIWSLKEHNNKSKNKTN